MFDSPLWKSPLFLSGLLAWAVAVGFGVFPTVQTHTPPNSQIVVNPTRPAASFSFAITGGMCMLGAGVADRRGGRAENDREKGDATH